VAFLTLVITSPARAQTDCGLLQDCLFDNFYGDEGAGSGAWKIFTLSDPPPFIALANFEGFPRPPALWIYRDNAAFDGGIYQVVAVKPGYSYHFEIVWSGVSHNGRGWQEGNQIARKIGIDPLGGTDAKSPNVHWIPDYLGPKKLAEDLQLDEYARSDHITVFIRVANGYTDGKNEVFWKGTKLIENVGVPPIQVSAPTATSAPPTATKPAPTPRATRVPATATAEPTTAPTASPAPSDTSAPTRAPTATVIRRAPRVTPTPEPESTATSIDPRLAMLGIVCVLGLGGVGVLVLGGVLFWWWRKK
jgi:hypothetical protein